jgi:hypothetical protein
MSDRSNEYSQSNLKEIKEGLNTLYKTVYQGNGTPSLVTQVSRLEHRLSTLEDKMDVGFDTIDKEMSLKFKNITEVVNEKFNNISYQIENEFAKTKEDASNKWSFKTSTLTAGIAGLSSIISVIVAKMVWLTQ